MEKGEQILPWLFQLTWKQWDCVRYWGCVSPFALMQKCKSKYQGQRDKGRAPVAVPMAKLVLDRLLDPPEPQFPFSLCVFCLML